MELQMNWLWPLSAALVSTVYFFLIKYYTIHRAPIIILSVIFLELLVIYLYYRSLLNTKSGTMYAVINGLSVILGALIAIFFFGEHIKMTDVLGIGIIIAGILIVGKR